MMHIGRVVLAKAGRDRGKSFVIVGVIDEEYVLIANGTNRSIDKPKRKKIRHLTAQPDVLEIIKEKIIKNQKIFDAEIRKSLESLIYDEK
ncbi:MAG TPA: KOW domain-containing RNA-binding protein [Clostridia bacterium]|nr:KOW domain-containing RNA-binding protein [Clostridia bacterium]